MSKATIMEIDDSEAQSLKKKAETLHRLSAGPLSSSLSKLSYSSRAIPSERDFHFFYNFDEFKSPVKKISDGSQLMLERVGTSTHVWGKDLVFPEDLDDAYDWLVNVNDELFERLDVSTDEFQSSRKKEQEGGNLPVGLDDGFQLVYGKRKKKDLGGRENVGLVDRNASAAAAASASASAGVTGVKVASRDKKVAGAKPRVPFHIPTIPRPQDAFNILVNNSNQPFQHVWLQRSEDDTRLVHPLEKLSALDFVAKDTENIEPVKPRPIEHTPFKLVEEVKDLKVLAAKLRAVEELAVDLEHNQYRSFQGMTCLMQISTRSEDFVVDTLKLRIHVGPYLREVFKDPSKKKVMHGADKDILWLQRDFGIYVCNMFDTGQASRALKLERNSLEYLLHHFCGVTADKEYQNADWRLRPLPYEMLKYAREDTHYLLQIYDLMRIRLLTTTAESESSDNLLVEVYKRSYDVCMQLYEKELLTESSYLYIYGLQRADLNSQQLAVVAGLCEWRDVVARAEDESTGYILPNKTLLEIAKEMPVTTSKLRRLLKTKHPYVERNLGSVVSIIRHSIQNASAFEVAAEHLKQVAAEHLKQVAAEQLEEQMEKDSETSAITGVVNDGTEKIGSADKINGSMSSFASVQPEEGPMEVEGSLAEIGGDEQGVSLEPPHENLRVKTEIDCYPAEQPSVSPAAKLSGATVQLLKKPTRAFGALFGNSAQKRKSDLDSKCKERLKLEQIKSSVNLPFYSFSESNDQTKPFAEEPTKAPGISPPKDLHSTPVATNSNGVSETPSPEDPHSTPAAVAGGLEDIISLDDNSDVEDSRDDDADTINERLESTKTQAQDPGVELDHNGEPMSLSDLSTSFQQCFESMPKIKTGKTVSKSQDSRDVVRLEPFDYETARQQFRFGKSFKEESGLDGGEDCKGRLNSSGKKSSSRKGQAQKAEGTGELSQGKRRQAFPASGNRSATFRPV